METDTQPTEQIANVLLKDGFLTDVECDTIYNRAWDRLRKTLATEPNDTEHNARSSIDRTNPLVDAARSVFAIAASESKRCAEERIQELLFRLAEHPKLRASHAAVFLYDQKMETLRAVAGHNVNAKDRVIHVHHSKGIIAHVARAHEGYYAKDVDQDPYYFKYYRLTKSELAVPILSRRGKLLAVINLESHKPGAFGEENASGGHSDYVTDEICDLLDQVTAAMLIDLGVLRSLQLSEKYVCPWHPRVHGWDLQKLLTRLCSEVSSVLDQATTACTLWYGDRRTGTAFVFATSGYDYSYLAKDELPIHLSKVGEMMEKADGMVVSFTPETDPVFFDKKKAIQLGIDRVHMCQLRTLVPSDRQRCSAVLSILTRNQRDVRMEEEREKLIQRSLSEFVNFVRSKVTAFVRLRNNAIADTLGEQIDLTKPNAFRRVLRRVQKILGAPAGSIFAGRPNSDMLECVSTTGFLVNSENDVAEAHFGQSGFAYSMEHHADCFTVNCALNPGEVIRMNHTNDSCERGLPDWLPSPSRPTSHFAEFIARSDPRNRRLLMVGFQSASGATGVIRVVRSKRNRPFLACDEDLLLGASEWLKIALEYWVQHCPTESMFSYSVQPQVSEGPNEKGFKL